MLRDDQRRLSVLGEMELRVSDERGSRVRKDTSVSAAAGKLKQIGSEKSKIKPVLLQQETNSLRKNR